MNRISLCLTALTLGSVASAPTWGEEPPLDSDRPLQGAVAHGKALAFAIEDGREGVWRWINVRLAALAVGAKSESFACDATQRPPLLWHIAHKHAWISSYETDAGSTQYSMKRFRLDDLLAGKLVTAPGAEEVSMHGGDGDYLSRDFYPLSYARLHGALDDVNYPFHLCYDYLPTSEEEVQFFILCNVAGAGEPPGADGKTENLSVLSLPYTDPKREKEHWSLTEFQFHNSWDAKIKYWGEGTCKRVGEIQVGFKEAFHALGKGDDYYFLTVSGKLYRAPKPDKGADRKMEAVWDEAKRPVVAFITDADADRTFLFCKPDKEGKGVYFEMSDKPDPQPYDASKVPEAKPDDPLPAVLAYAKILVADKKIKEKE